MQQKTLLLATFVNISEINDFITKLNREYGLDEKEVFVYEFNPTTYVTTYRIITNIEDRFDIKRELPRTIHIHKKQNTFFTINALNKLITQKSGLDSGNINFKEYIIDWGEYSNKIILINNDELEITPIKRKFL